MNKRIIIVDDDPLIIRYYERVLNPQTNKEKIQKNKNLINSSDENTTILPKKYKITVAESGEEAIKKVRKSIDTNKPFSLAFIDMLMPGIDGAETAKEISKLDKNIKLVIVTASNSISIDEITKIVKRDDIFFLAKPFKPLEICQFAKILTKEWTLNRKSEWYKNKLKRAIREDRSNLINIYNKIQTLDKEKMDFIYFLSHEMNTPLLYFKALDAIDKSKFNEEDLRMLQIVDKGFLKIKKLTKNIISYFELGANTLKLDFKTISVKSVIEHIIDIKDDLIHKDNIKIINNCKSSLNVKADFSSIIKLFEIILDNSIVFSKPNDTITINETYKDNKVTICISDNGIGIEKEDLNNIFKPFVIDSFKRNQTGYGLNLPKAKLLAEAHGWEIWAESDGKNCGVKLMVEMKVE